MWDDPPVGAWNGACKASVGLSGHKHWDLLDPGMPQGCCTFLSAHQAGDLRVLQVEGGLVVALTCRLLISVPCKVTREGATKQ